MVLVNFLRSKTYPFCDFFFAKQVIYQGSVAAPRETGGTCPISKVGKKIVKENEMYPGYQSLKKIKEESFSFHLFIFLRLWYLG